MGLIYVGYGIGYYYSLVSEKIKEKMKLSYLCDRQWDGLNIDSYDGIPVISRDRLAKLECAKAVIFARVPTTKESIAGDLKKIGIDYMFADDILSDQGTVVTGERIRAEGADGIWEDERGNRIFYDETLSDHISVSIRGVGNTVRFGKNIMVNQLVIWLGNHGRVEIGAGTTIVNIKIYAAYASVFIGKDCLFSSEVVLRTHDAHHIFDRNTLSRINDSKDTVLHDHVWVGARGYLLAGTEIGTGSVVGANAVTSGQFKDHVIIAGVPAKVIREDICWSRDDTDLANHMHLEECVHREALKYL